MDRATFTTRRRKAMYCKKFMYVNVSSTRQKTIGVIANNRRNRLVLLGPHNDVAPRTSKSINTALIVGIDLASREWSTPVSWETWMGKFHKVRKKHLGDARVSFLEEFQPIACIARCGLPRFGRRGAL